MSQYLAILVVVATLVLATVAILQGLEFWFFTAGLVAGGVLVLAIWVYDEPPEYIAKWGRGASGEERTGKELEALVAEGWQVRHDIELEPRRGNVDHLLRSPSGRAYLLETKTLAGTIALEQGQLVCRMADDDEEIRRYRLGPKLIRETARVRHEWAKRSGRSAPDISPIVVIWGAFASEAETDGGVAYVRGEYLVSYLRSADSRDR